MKKSIALFLLAISSTYVGAQSYMGYLTDNYSGVNSVIANPANIVDSRFKMDLNLVGVSLFAGNDFYGINIMDATKADYDFDRDAKKHPTTDNNLGLNMDIMGPSFMFNLTGNSSLAVFTRGRFFANVNEVNGETIDALDDDGTNDFTVDEGDFSFLSQLWVETGIAYARVFLHEEEHFFKAGLTLKHLRGAGSGYAHGKNVTITYDGDGTDLGEGETTGSLTSTGTVVYGRFAEIDNEDYEYELPDDAKGFGADLGFVYEWRPEHVASEKAKGDEDLHSLKDVNKYKLRLGISITDMGSVNYKNGKEETFDITNTAISEEDIDNEENIDDILNNLYALTATKVGYRTLLPTALHINADWSFDNRFYLNFGTGVSLISKGKERASRISNVVSLTPRFERKWFGFYLPFSIIQNNGFQIGAGLRAGPLYVGSGSLLSVLTGNNSRGADVYAGLKIPIYQGKPKDGEGSEVSQIN